MPCHSKTDHDYSLVCPYIIFPRQHMFLCFSEWVCWWQTRTLLSQVWCLCNNSHNVTQTEFKVSSNKEAGSDPCPTEFGVSPASLNMFADAFPLWRMCDQRYVEEEPLLNRSKHSNYCHGMGKCLILHAFVWSRKRHILCSGLDPSFPLHNRSYSRHVF